MKRVGKYEICGLLGKGGMGVVYKARLPVVNKIVALKLLQPHPSLLSFLGSREVEDRFAREASLMASLRHPNVVDVLDYDYADGHHPFFTMEYFYQNLGVILGESPRVEIPCRPLSLDKAIHYMRQLLVGLSRLHRAGMIHRDIKPYNLLITDDDTLKICDFGLSKLRGEVVHDPPNVVMGSPYYAAPEQEKDPQGADEGADIYSAGVVLYRMLSGRLPQLHENESEALHPDTDGPWEEFVFRAIRSERKERFDSTEEMLIELEKLAETWEIRKRDFCQAEPNALLRPITPKYHAPAIRSRPVKVNPLQAPQIFTCDRLFRPRRYVDNVFEFVDCCDAVLDRCTGLLWQRTGSQDPLDWHDAHRYVENLNRIFFASRTKWRLPTVDELFSVLRHYEFGMGECIQSVFDRGRKWLWTCDRRSFSAGWYVDAELGFTGWSDFSCRYYARAVCTA